jgi:hypothetical protein
VIVSYKDEKWKSWIFCEYNEILYLIKPWEEMELEFVKNVRNEINSNLFENPNYSCFDK